MNSLDGIINQYFNMKDRRRQAERDTVADKQYADSQVQQGLNNDYRTQTLADTQVNQALSEKNYQQRLTENSQVETQRQKQWDEKNQVIANEAYGDLKRNVLKNYTQRGNDANGGLTKSVNYNGAADDNNVREGMDRLYKNDPRILSAVQGRNPEVESVAGIKFMEYDSGDGETSTRAVMMLNMKDGTQKPLSQRGGRDDGVVAMDMKEIFEFTDGIMTGAEDTVGVASSLQNVSKSYMDDGAEGSGTTVTMLGGGGLGEQQDVDTKVEQTTQSTDTADTTVPSLKDTQTQTSVSEVDSTYTTPIKAEVPEPELTNEERVYELVLDAAAKYSDAGATGNNPAMQEQIENILLDDVMSMTGATIEDATRMIREARDPSRGNSLGNDNDAFSGYEGLSGAEGTGRALGQTVDLIDSGIEGAGRVITNAAKSDIATVKKIWKGFTGSNTDPSAAAAKVEVKTEPRVNPTDAKTLIEDAGDEIKQQDPAAKQDNVEQAKQNVTTVVGSKKKTKQVIGTAYDRALDIMTLEDAGHIFTSEQKARYVATGSMSKELADKIDQVTIGNFDYQRNVDKDGNTTYTPLGMNGTAARAMDKAEIAKVEAQETATVAQWDEYGQVALGEAAIVQYDEKGVKKSGIGPFASQDNLGLYARIFVEKYGDQLESLLEFNPAKLENPDEGQKLVIQGVVTAYAASLARSKNGDRVYSTMNDFSKFIKSYSAKSGTYYINNTLVSLEAKVNKKMKQKPGLNRAVLMDLVRADLENQQGPIDE